MTTDLSSTHADGRDWIIETDRLRLRAITVNDTALMLAVWNDPTAVFAAMNRQGSP
jgi:hypothetical protein